VTTEFEDAANVQCDALGFALGNRLGASSNSEPYSAGVRKDCRKCNR
jgi:hypothetical protein